MGLDMYLHAKKYVEKIDWSKLDRDNGISMDSPEVINPLWKDIVNVSDLSDVATDIYGVNVDVTCAYWRKANQIHAWFVDNVQRGVDDCGEYYVSHEKLKELLDLVNKALSKRDPNLLQPRAGFFFGSYDIDEWYWNDLKNTKAKLERIFALPEMSKLSFYYTSSW
jgi:hypothetical protein